jgi:hypothetical protein
MSRPREPRAVNGEHLNIGDVGNRWNDLHYTTAVKLAARASKR